MIPEHVEARQRHEGGEAREQVERVEHDGVRAVSPRSLERVAQAAVVMSIESLERERRSQEIAAQALELGAVAAVDGTLGVDVDAADLGVEGERRGDRAHGAHELGGAAARRALPRACTSAAEALATEARTGCSHANESSSGVSRDRPRRSSARTKPAWVQRATSSTSPGSGGPSAWKTSAPLGSRT